MMDALTQILSIPIGSYAAWGALLVVAVSGVIQVSPIKVDPWSIMARKIGKAINQDIISKVDDLESTVAEIQKVNDERAAREDERNACIARQRILRFGDEVRHGQNHSEEHYNDILEDITAYENYCDTHPNFKNQKAQSTIKIIVKAYERHMQQNDFLV